MRRKRQEIKRRLLAKGEPRKEKEKEQPIIYYECKKPGHFRSECPQFKKGQEKFKKKKVMMATWSDSDNSITDKKIQKEANLCLMAHENEVSPETQNEFTYDELLEAFHELLDDLKELRIKNKNLKLKNQVLAKEKEELKN